MTYDIVIIGGGLVGASLAVSLRESGWNMALVDARLPSANDPRLFALNASSCQFLKNLGLWPAFADHAAPIHEVHVSRQGRFGSVRLTREEIQLPLLGNVIPALHLESALNAALQTLPNCTVYRPASLKYLHQQNQLATLTLITEEGEEILQSRLVIGADGTDSTVRKQLNIAAEVVDYHQSAMVTRIKLKRPHQQIAYERFHGKGAIAMLPLPENECACIWSGENEMIARWMTLSDPEFLAELQREFGYRLGKLQALTTRHVFPLRMVRAEKAVDQCVYLLGNAAHTLHPIAAQGFNLALYEVATLAESFCDQPQIDLEAIHVKTLKRQAKSMGVSHRLPESLSSGSFVKDCLLQLGMMGLDMVVPFKKRFMQDMIGLRGETPRLLTVESAYERKY